MWHYWNLGLRCAFVAVFLVSAASKVRGRSAFAEFAASARAIGGLPAGRAAPVAVAVVAVEAAVAVLTALPATATAGLGLAAAVLVGFSAAIVRALRREQTVRCRCFGPSATPLGRVHVVRNLALAALAVTGLYTGPPAGLAPAGVVLALCAGALVAAVAVRFDEIVELFLIR